MYRKTKSPNKNLLDGPKKSLLILASASVVIVIAVTALEMADKTHFFHDRKAVSGIITSTSSKGTSKPAVTQSNDKTTGNVPSSPASDSPENQKQGDATTAPAPTGAAPLTPFGDFISNHTPNLDGNPAPSSVESVCNTSPGAECYIEFTNTEGVIKTLETRKTDTNGAAYWGWDIKKAGLTVGTWKIKVTAKLNAQSVSATSAQNLVVNP